MKFKIGDKVRFVEDTDCGSAKVGDRGVIFEVKNYGCPYHVKLTDGRKAWCLERRVVLDKSGNKIVITIDGTETVARLFDGKECVKTATAKCSPDDEFDFEVGARIAFDRLVKKEERDFDFYIRLRNNGGYHFARKGDVLKAHEECDGLVHVVGKDFPRKTDIDDFKWAFTDDEYDRITDEEAQRELAEKDEFVPHLELNGNHYGNIGEPTNYKDAIGRPLCVGDVVEHFNDENVSFGDTMIVQAGVVNVGKIFVMGIESSCDDKRGTTGLWKIIKKRSYEEVKHGEIGYCGVKWVKEP